MTILNTGSNKKFSSGWENIFSGKETKKKESVAAVTKVTKRAPVKKTTPKKKPAAATKPAKKSKKK